MLGWLRYEIPMGFLKGEFFDRIAGWGMDWGGDGESGAVGESDYLRGRPALMPANKQENRMSCGSDSVHPRGGTVLEHIA